MSQERWDVVIRVTSGPMVAQGEIVARGPVVRLGANPGPGGLLLRGYRGLDDRQAVVTAYDGTRVSIAPVGQNAVRTSTHDLEDWSAQPQLREPVYLSPGDHFHLGAPDRGVTCVFVECRRLGDWAEQQILSEAAQGAANQAPTQVEEIDARGRVPWWFVAGMVSIGLATIVGVTVPLIGVFTRDPGTLGPVDEGREYYDFADASIAVDPALRRGLDQPFRDFVMLPNEEQADWEGLADDPSKWDPVLVDYVTRSATLHAQGWRFWMRLEQITEEYAYVVEALRDAGLPVVFAAIPYQESRYHLDEQSVACAKGPWQLMPETAWRMGLDVRDCQLKGSTGMWSPQRAIPVLGVMKNAPYVDPEARSCRIERCVADERSDLAASTKAAIQLLAEAYNDREIAASGAAVQLAILSHNAGYDDSRFEERKVKPLNVLMAYRADLERNALEVAPDVYGRNITCLTPDDQSTTCGGVLHKETQHYGYNVIAQHLLAACYYAQNHGNLPVFAEWREYTRGDGYCTAIRVPTAAQLREREGR